MSDAAQLTGVSRSTIRRYRESGRFPDAFKNAKDEWMIPLENLLAVGLSPTDPSAKVITLGGQGQEDAQASPSGRLSKEAQEVNRLRRELEVERARREGVENVLEEVRRRANLAERALAMLEAPKGQDSPIAMPAAQAAPTPPPAAPEAAPEPPKKKWWQRG